MRWTVGEDVTQGWGWGYIYSMPVHIDNLKGNRSSTHLKTMHSLFIILPAVPSHRLALLRHNLLSPSSPLETSRSAFHKSPNSTQIPLMPEEKRLLATFAPEIDGVGKSVDGLLVATDERAAEVNALQVVFFRLQVGDLADVVAVRDITCQLANFPIENNSLSKQSHLIAYSRLREMSAGANMRPSPISLLPVPSFLLPSGTSPFSP